MAREHERFLSEPEVEGVSPEKLYYEQATINDPKKLLKIDLEDTIANPIGPDEVFALSDPASQEFEVYCVEEETAPGSGIFEKKILVIDSTANLTV